MLVEAAWAAAAGPGPLRAFFIRMKDKRGKQVAAVATARKLAVVVWHLLSKEQNYTWARPALVAWKRRNLSCRRGIRLGGAEAKPAQQATIASDRCAIANMDGSAWPRISIVSLLLLGRTNQHRRRIGRPDDQTVQLGNKASCSTDFSIEPTQ